MQPKSAQVIIELDGGIVHSVLSNVPVEYVIYDTDLEGASDDELTCLPDLDGSEREVEVYDHGYSEATLKEDVVSKVFAAVKGDGADETPNSERGVLGYLDCSTAHLSVATRNLLQQGRLQGMTVAPYEYGAFVSVPDYSDEEEIAGLDDAVPKDLEGVLRHAHGLGCAVVRFDADAPLHPGLPDFED